uniref:Putative methyltransferase n=1 Tax=viral metagenome TaxID=1070528 RepID=A0A6M3K5L6_9ZZZZ
MTESEYRNAELTINESGIWLGDVHIMPTAEDGLIQADVRRLCHEHKPRRVLELGFGLGLSATAFQEYGIAEHCIIEAHSVIAARARQWAAGRPGIEIIEGFAQTVPVPDGAWDLVFDDRYDLTDTALDVTRFVHRYLFTCRGYGGN